MFDKLTKNNLVWFPEKGIGYYPVSGNPYNDEYIKHYQECSCTEMGKSITKSRIELVKKYYDGALIDVGVGSGHFLLERGNTFGYDVNISSVNWIKSIGLYRCLYSDCYESATFWDSLEHIEKPEYAIKHVGKFAFVSIPIFTNCEHIIKSKHYKKTEHFWYFTKNGLVDWFIEQGFECLEINSMETDLGREDIGTFVFGRCNA
ncbi:MAG: hypothetical protein WC998_06070 [Candidatus Paceibacterota bacterium]|jgi:hypothetical protein